MKSYGVLLFGLLLASCHEIPYEPLQPISLIVAHVHWQSQDVAGVPVVLVQTGDSVHTNSNGLAIFSVSAGHYVIRAYGINRGGPALRSIDFNVEVHTGETAIVDIIDCLPCV
jgi:hypothetical protein